MENGKPWVSPTAVDLSGAKVASGNRNSIIPNGQPLIIQVLQSEVAPGRKGGTSFTFTEVEVLEPSEYAGKKKFVYTGRLPDNTAEGKIAADFMLRLLLAAGLPLEKAQKPNLKISGKTFQKVYGCWEQKLVQDSKGNVYDNGYFQPLLPEEYEALVASWTPPDDPKNTKVISKGGNEEVVEEAEVETEEEEVEEEEEAEEAEEEEEEEEEPPAAPPAKKAKTAATPPKATPAPAPADIQSKIKALVNKTNAKK